MSDEGCGDLNGDADCSEVIESVYLFLDGEIREADKSRVRAHLDDCAPCLRRYGIEQEVKALVARCCGDDVAPTELRTKVMLRLQEVRVSYSRVEYRAD
jgi:mycothiol system anti-sigma-R factor